MFWLCLSPLLSFFAYLVSSCHLPHGTNASSFPTVHFHLKSTITSRNGFNVTPISGVTPTSKKTLRPAASNNTGRVIHGKLAGFWPFAAAICNYKDKSLDQFCGGSIVNDDTILTAVHCIFNTEKAMIKPTETVVFIGGEHLHKATKSQIFKVKKFYYNKVFVDTLKIKGAENFDFVRGGDIALIKLARKINFNRFGRRARKVCFPDPDVKPNSTDCWVIGWGTTEKGKSSSSLMQARVPIVKPSTCKHRFGDYNEKQLICAGTVNGKKGADACQGDSGGPLLCSIHTTPKRYLQFGIVSYGEDCGVGGQYQRTSPWIDWIRKHAEKKVTP